MRIRVLLVFKTLLALIGLIRVVGGGAVTEKERFAIPNFNPKKII